MATAYPSTDQDWATNPSSASTTSTTATANHRHTSGRSLRKSCDRCHQQKLRCEGSKVSLVACSRCQRAGVDCVYSVRSSKQPNKHSSRNQSIDCGHSVQASIQAHTQVQAQVPAPPAPATPTPSHDFNVLDTFDADLLPSGDDFNTTPSRWDPLGMQAMAEHVLTPPQTHSVPTTMSTGGTSVMLGLADVTASPPTVNEDSADISVRLCTVSQALEGIFRRIAQEPADTITPQYIVDELFSTFNGFIRVLTLDSMRPRPMRGNGQSPLDEYMDTKHGSMAAQCYVLSVNLMVYLSEKLLQSLLVSPASTPRSPFGLGTADTTAQIAGGGLGGASVNFGERSDHDSNMMLGGLGPEDLCSAPTVDSFDHVLDSTVNMLQTGTSLLGRMEQLLEIPPRIAAGGGAGGQGGPMSHYTTTTTTSPGETQQQQQQQQQQQHSQQQTQNPRIQSLPARLVQATWDHETTIGNKCPVSYFKRCRAAILGLAQNH